MIVEVFPLLVPSLSCACGTARLRSQPAPNARILRTWSSLIACVWLAPLALGQCPAPPYPPPSAIRRKPANASAKGGLKGIGVKRGSFSAKNENMAKMVRPYKEKCARWPAKRQGYNRVRNNVKKKAMEGEKGVKKI